MQAPAAQAAPPLSAGRDYRLGTRLPLRPCPRDFRETFLRLGWDRAIEEHYRTNWRCIARWIEECGGEELRAARAAISGYRTRPDIRSTRPTYAEAVAASTGTPAEMSASSHKHGD